MYLFIFESIGTSELILIGIVALIFLGPRKLPEMARKIGKMMAEFRGTASEFKQTWQREVTFEEEVKALNLNDLIKDDPVVLRVDSIAEPKTPTPPVIREIDPAKFDLPAKTSDIKTAESGTEPVDSGDKKNWL